MPAAVRAAVDRLGGLDLLINNAGVGGPAPAELPPDEVVRQQLEVNLLAAWRTTAAALPALIAARGRVVFVASRMAVLPLPLAAAYGVSKRALVAYADALRHEVGTHVGVSVVYPSMVASPIHDSTADAGLSLSGVSRPEPVRGVVAAILRAATARRAPRDVATTRRGRLELAAGPARARRSPTGWSAVPSPPGSPPVTSTPPRWPPGWSAGTATVNVGRWPSPRTSSSSAPTSGTTCCCCPG